MINLYHAEIQEISIHKVGNKNRAEGLFVSRDPYLLTDELKPLIKEYFFKAFREKEENYYRFVHETDLEFHPLFQWTQQLFQNPERTHELSAEMTKHLYDQSEHPHIKPGEVYICHIENVSLDNEKMSAIGIFKSEIKQEFLQFSESKNSLEPRLEQGVNLGKLDKGCVIFDKEEEEGYKILSIDSNRYDAKYWLEQFLSIDVLSLIHI